MNQELKHIKGVDTYTDKNVVYSDIFEEHLINLRKFFDRLKLVNLAINYVKSDFCQTEVTYLGHVVVHGRISPHIVNVQVIMRYRIPDNAKDYKFKITCISLVIIRRRYSNIKKHIPQEQKSLAIISSLQHFKIYLAMSQSTIVVFTNFNTLVFIEKMKTRIEASQHSVWRYSNSI